MFYCESCGNVFDEPDEVEESRGEFWGMPCSETMYYCPCCGDNDFSKIMEMDGYDKPIYINSYYWETTIVGKDGNGSYTENFSEESFEENWKEILEDYRTIVERKYAK